MHLPPWAPLLVDGDLRLRGHTPDDVPGMLDQCQDPQTQRWTTLPVPYTHDDAVDFVRRRPAEWQAGGPLALAIELTGRFAGTVDLGLDDVGAARLGYGLAPWARGRGAMTRALRLFLPWAIDALQLELITWAAAAGNWTSRRVAWACGFEIAPGVVPARLLQRGRRLDAWTGWLLPGRPLQPRHAWLQPPVLSGCGGVLRPLRAGDERTVQQACSDPLTRHRLPMLPSPYTLEDAIAHLAAVGDEQARGRAVHWAVANPRDPALALLGKVTVTLHDHGGEVGYWAHPAGRGRGLITAAVRLAARHALLPREDGGLGLRRVLLRAAEDNAASRRVAERVGFRQVGTDRDGEQLRDGSVRDLVRYDLLADECPEPTSGRE